MHSNRYCFVSVSMPLHLHTICHVINLYKQINIIGGIGTTNMIRWQLTISARYAPSRDTEWKVEGGGTPRWTHRRFTHARSDTRSRLAELYSGAEAQRSIAEHFYALCYSLFKVIDTVSLCIGFSSSTLAFITLLGRANPGVLFFSLLFLRSSSPGIDKTSTIRILKLGISSELN